MIKTTQRKPVIIQQLICDECESVIHTQTGGKSLTENDSAMYQVAKDFRDLNRGHECKYCKKQRERAYDNYVTSP